LARAARSESELQSFPKMDLRGLGAWVCFSGLVHLAVIAALFLFPWAPSGRRVSYPVYTVDLVGGEKLGGMGVGAGALPEKRPPAKAIAAPPPAKAVKAEKKEPKPEVRKPVEKSPAKAREREVATLPEKSVKAKEPEPAPAEKPLPGDLREKLIQAALERVRQRARQEGDASAEKRPADAATKGGFGQSTGGETPGAAGPGTGGTGGGIVRGFEFVAYHNKMLQTIKERWTWVGRRTDLEVTVRFGIRENGEIVGLRIVQPSGDPGYDDSVLRAVRRANPLEPPPEKYRADFMDVELTFRPRDLRG
jgi:TolA protein